MNVVSNFNKFYVDRNNNIHVDEQQGYFSSVQRLITSLLGVRNYDILDVLKVASSTKEISETQVKVIFEKAGKKLHITADSIDRLFLAIRSNDNQNHLDAASNLKKEQIANFEKLKKYLDPKSESYEMVSKIIKEAQLKSKMTGIKLDPQLAHEYPEDIEFLIKTRLIYSILGFQNTTETGVTNHALQKNKDADGNAYLSIKKQGKWVSVKQIKEEFVWDEKEQALANKANLEERWNYFYEGLVPIDRFYHHEESHAPLKNMHLKPVAKLSQKEMQFLLDQAQSFDGNQKNVSQPRNCVVQVISNPRPHHSATWLKNLDGQIPVHCGIRIIQEDGIVYSTGFGSTLAEDKYNEGLNKFLGTINGQPTIMDYEEFRAHDGRIVTSIPVTAEQTVDILNHLNDYREKTIRFNIFKQNCMKLGTNVLSMAGVDLDIRIPLEQMLYRALPDLQYKPAIFLHGRIKDLSSSIENRTPECVKAVFSELGKIIFFIPNKIGILMKNLLGLALGGHIGSPIRRNQAVTTDMGDFEEIQSDDDLENFNRLVQNLFDEEASDIYHSSVFIHWQLQQKSTIVHAYTGQPNMHILPPHSEEAKKYSEKRKAEFTDIYKYSAGMISKVNEDDLAYQKFATSGLESL